MNNSSGVLDISDREDFINLSLFNIRNSAKKFEEEMRDQIHEVYSYYFRLDEPNDFTIVRGIHRKSNTQRLPNLTIKQYIKTNNIIKDSDL
jgi:hypothetical protein